MSVLDARSVTSLLREYAQRTALLGGNPYRAKAYARAADSLATIAGTATESLIRTLSDFRSEKLIDIQNGSIKILNEKKLATLAN